MVLNRYNKRLSSIFVFNASIISAALLAIVLTDPTNAVSTSGSVKLSTTLGNAISMSITGNADGADCTSRGFDSCSTFGQMLPNSYMTTSSLISVYTNSSDGYSLSVRANNHTDLRADSSNSIPAGVLSGETGGQGLWSYKTDGTGVKTNWTAITTTDTTIKGTSIYSASTSDTTVTYGVSISDAQTSGSYSTTLIYTATAPNDTEIFEPNPTANFSGDHVTFSASSVPVASGSTGTITITPAEGYYLSSFSCTNGYTNNATTGSSAISAQTVTITNPSVAKSSTCIANASQIKDITLLTSMQDLANHPEYCANSVVGTTKENLPDERDPNGKKYKIRKLADGNCWMIGNMKIAGVTIESTKSNVPAGTSFNLPATIVGSGSVVGPTWDNQAKESYVIDANSVVNSDGYLYNWFAATAGAQADVSDTSNSLMTASSGSAVGDICPKGWKLPDNVGNKSFYNLYNVEYPADSGIYPYQSVANMRNTDGIYPAFVSTGYYYYATGLISTTGSGFYWSRVVSNGARSRDMKFNSSTVYPQAHDEKGYSFAIRCVSAQ